MPDFREIRAISHQTSHPRIKTSRFFCKDSHPASYYVCNSPHFKQSPPRTRRKESCSKLCVATQNYAAEHSRGHDAKKTSRNSASWHRTTQQSTRFFCKGYHPARDFVHNSPRFTDNRLPYDHVVRKTRHFTDKAPHFTIYNSGTRFPHHQNKRVRQRFLCQTLYHIISGNNRRSDFRL